jgi:dolichol-phosphate mannosyltransferase
LNERDNIEVVTARLDDALSGIGWEAIFVDDDSADGTIERIRDLARVDGRIRAMRRIKRRGLAGACIEGMLASSAPFVAVMDADLQHDERRLVEMYDILSAGRADVVVASRYLPEGHVEAGLSRARRWGSRSATRLARYLLNVSLHDPMSGFFMIRREIVDGMAGKLSQQGFKLLLDILASASKPLRIEEIPYVFGPRLHGTSKLDSSVVLAYLGLLVAKLSGDLVSARFLAFGLVGTSGVVVHLAILAVALRAGSPFAASQTAAMIVAMISNYSLNNLLTYRDRRRRGWRFLSGLALFGALCSFGLVAGVGISTLFYQRDPQWWVAGLAGAAVGAVWNYVTNSAVTWRAA